MLTENSVMTTCDAWASRVRVATRRDEDELMELCRREHSENGSGAFSPFKVMHVLRRAFDPSRNDPAIIGVVGKSCIEGSICLVANVPWNAEEPFLDVLWNYVMPGFRKSTNARDLIAFARQLSGPPPEGLGLPLRMKILANVRTESQAKLYRRELGEPTGFMWTCDAAVGER